MIVAVVEMIMDHHHDRALYSIRNGWHLRKYSLFEWDQIASTLNRTTTMYLRYAQAFQRRILVSVRYS